MKDATSFFGCFLLSFLARSRFRSAHYSWHTSIVNVVLAVIHLVAVEFLTRTSEIELFVSTYKKAYLQSTFTTKDVEEHLKIMWVVQGLFFLIQDRVHRNVKNDNTFPVHDILVFQRQWVRLRQFSYLFVLKISFLTVAKSSCKRVVFWLDVYDRTFRSLRSSIELFI